MNRKTFKLPYSFGQSIIEIVLSIGLASMVIAALVILGSAALRTSTSASRRAEATKLANSGVEAIRFLRDANGFNSIAMPEDDLPKCYEIASGQVIINQTDCNEESQGWSQVVLDLSRSDDIFYRKILVERYGLDTEDFNMVKVTSTVRWAESPGSTIGGEENQRSVVVSTVLSSW